MIERILDKLQKVMEVYDELSSSNIDDIKGTYDQLGEEINSLEDEIRHLKDEIIGG